MAQDGYPGDENPVKTILVDTFYGLVTGALVGAAISAPQHDPDWQQNIGSGAAIGAVGGLIFGIVSEGKPLVTESKAILNMEDSRVSFRFPTLKTTVQQDEEQSQTNYYVNLMCYRF
jgi:hypothetical protein